MNEEGIATRTDLRRGRSPVARGTALYRVGKGDLGAGKPGERQVQVIELFTGRSHEWNRVRRFILTRRFPDEENTA